MMFLYDLFGTPFGWIMYGIYSLVNNYAVAIILFTIVTKLILFPISYRQQLSSARMQRLTPKINKLREKYKDDREKLQQEQTKLYQEEHVNPSGGCLPMILQFVLLFGVMDAVYKPLSFILRLGDDLIDGAFEIVEKIAPDIASNSSGLREELAILQVHHSDPESFLELLGGAVSDKMAEFYQHFTLFGVDLGSTPTFSPETWNVSAVVLVCIPFASGIIQLAMTLYSQSVQKKRGLSQQQNGKQTSSGCMNVMLFIMPLFSVWFAFQVPAGVGFYWICSSAVSFVQTIGLNRWFSEARVEKICEKHDKKMQKKYASGKRTTMQRITGSVSEAQKLRDENAEKAKNMSRSELSKFNQQRINDARRLAEEKYGATDEICDTIETSEPEQKEILEGRRRMAAKYGDRYDEPDDES